MATLASPQVQALRRRLNECSSPWILACLQSQKPRAKSMQGILGYLDWRLHGKISQAFRQDILPMGGLSFFANRGKLGKANLLVYHWDEEAQALKTIQASLESLQAKEICVATSSFPEDFLLPLQKSIEKMGIEWIKLENNAE